VVKRRKEEAISMRKIFRFLGVKGLAIFGFLGVKALAIFGFLGKEVMGRLTGIHFFLIGIFLLGFLFLFRFHSFYLQKRYGSRVVCFMSISLMFLTFLFCYSVRVYVGCFLSDVLTVVIGTCAVGEVNPQQQGTGVPSNQPLPVEPYPYSDTEVIGGDSVRAIQSRLLSKNPFPSAELINMARIEAQDLFEVKVDIFRIMSRFDPEGDWMGRGARALENPRTASGEESLEKLFNLRHDLQETGPLSDAFEQLRDKVPRRR